MEYLKKRRVYYFSLKFPGFNVKGFSWKKYFVCLFKGHKVNKYATARKNGWVYEFCTRCKGMVRR